MRARVNSWLVRNLMWLRRLGSTGAGVRSQGASPWLKRIAKAGILRILAPDGLVLLRVGGNRLLIPRRLSAWYALDGYESTTMRIFRSFLRPGMTVLDIGAHIGYYSINAGGIVGPAGRVIAFEPASENLKILRQNVILNGLENIDIKPFAVSAESGTAFLQIAEASDSHSLFGHPLSRTVEHREVRCVRIDDLTEARVDVVKIDVEGAEPNVLAGMTETLERHPDLSLFIELNPACLARSRHTAADLFDILWNLDFDITLVDERGGGVRQVEAGDHLNLPDDPSWYANLVCTPRRR